MVRQARGAVPAACHAHITPKHVRAQAIVELALIMPALFGIIVVLFQFGILFIAYVSLVNEMRDVGRFAAVHPDTIDGTGCATANSLWAEMCADAPNGIDTTKILSFGAVQGADSQTRSCAALVAGACTTRPAGSELRLQLQYDPTPLIFLPANFRLGPWFHFVLNLPPFLYAYSVMIEQN